VYLPFVVQTNTTYKMKVVCVGSSIKAFINDVEVISTTDTNILQGYAGLSTYQGSARFDNFTVAASGTGASPTHVYRKGPGTCTATLTVTDAAGQTSTDTATVNLVVGNPPSAEAGGPYAADEANAIAGNWSATFDGMASTDDGAIAFEWQVESDDFTGTTLNDRWLTSGSTQNGEVSIAAGSWGARYIFSKHYVYRNQAPYVAVQARIKPAAGPTAFGFKNNTTTYSYTAMPYCIYFASGGITIYENGTSRGATGYPFTSGSWYDVRIETKPTAGARYYYRPSGAGEWILLYDSTYSSETEFMPGVTVTVATAVDDFKVFLGGSATPTAHYYDPGTYDVSLTVTDRAGQTSTDSTAVTVTKGDAPVADAGADVNLDEHDAVDAKWTVNFDGVGSTDDFAIYRYEWDFGDGSATAIGRQVSHVYDATGVCTVTLTVTDNALQTSTDTLTVTISSNQPPVADAGGPYEVQETDVIAGTATVSFDGSGSSDDVGLVAYSWDFGCETFDGIYLDPAMWNLSYQVFPHAYGAYVTISGTSSWGARYMFSSYAAQKAPGLVAQASLSINGQAAFGFKNTTTTYSYTAMPYAIYFNSGTIQIYEDNVSRGSFGSYTQGAWYDLKIAIRPDGGAEYFYKPIADAQWTKLYTSSYLTASAQMKTGVTVYSGTCHVDNFHLSAAGQTVTVPVRHPAQVTLTVQDQARQTNSDTTTLAVAGSNPPVANPGGPYFSSYEAIVQFDGTDSTDDNGIVQYVWDFGDGTPTEGGPTPTHAYAIGDAAGSVKTVSLTVYDAGGHSDTRTTTVTLATGPKVICVPWQFSGGAEVPHSTYSGKSIRLKAVVKGGIGTLSYTWVFGDGTANATGNVVNRYAVEVSHAYTGSVGALFTATLTVKDSQNNSHSDTYQVKILANDLDTKVDIAIDEGLWYLHKKQLRDSSINHGRWSSYSTYYPAPTGAALQAFLINGHRETGDPAEDPYVETVRNGMVFLFRNLNAVTIANQTYGNPDYPFDGTGNGIGLEAVGGDAPYQGGNVMDAIVATATPGKIAWAGPNNVIGRTYKEILQDMIDVYSWGQYDNTSTTGGGWRYDWNTAPDNSACQWAAIGIIPSIRSPWFCSLPNWVRTRNDVWLRYSYNASAQAFGYTSSTAAGTNSNLATRPSGMVQLVMSVDDYKNEPDTETAPARWSNAEGWFATPANWTTFIGTRNYYAWYAFVKAMRLSETAVLSNGFNWFRGTSGIAEKLIAEQQTDGNWPNVSNTNGPGEGFDTAWSVIMLTSSLFELPPVAEAGHDVVWGYDVPLTFDASASYHLDPGLHIVLYEWDFDGDGTYDYSGTDPVVEHTYEFDSGASYPVTYTAVLKVIDENGLIDTDTRSVTIAQPPHAPFAVIKGPRVVDNVARGTVGLPVTFDGLDSYDIDPGDRITRYDWIFDGSSGYDFDNPDSQLAVDTFTYAREDTYNVALRVWDNGVMNLPNSDPMPSVPVYLAIKIEPNLPPVADAGGPYTVNEGTALPLLGTASDPNLAQDPLTYGWDLDGDGEFDDANTLATSHTWTQDGTYTIALRVSDGLLTSTDTAEVTVSDLGPTANFTWAPTSPGENTSVAFTDHSTTPNDPIVSREWDFAGLATSTQTNPSFTFVDDGIYEVTLTVTDTDGSTSTISKNVTVADRAPTAAFTWTPQSEGTPVQFTDQSTTPHDSIVSWSWNFAGRGTSTEQNPSFTFAESGTYQVTLTVIDDDGSVNSLSKNVAVADLAPTAEFSWLPEPANEGSPVQFTDESTTPHDPIVAWSWDFGGLGTSTQRNPAFTFMQHGVMAVTLRVTDSDGSQSTVTHNVTILDAGPTADFAWQTPITEGSPAAFTDQSTTPADPVVAWEWNFGGLGTSTQRNPAFTFTADGDYDVTLTVTDSDGSTDSTTKTVTVTDAAPTAEFTYAAQYEGLPVEFADQSTSPADTIVAWEWDFGGAGSSSEQNPSFLFDGSGTWSVTLTVTDADGSTDSVTHDVIVPDLEPLADFAWAPEPAGEGSPVQFTDKSTSPLDPIVSWQWDFAGLGSSTEASPSFTFTADGLYDVTLTITDSDGSISSATKTVTVLDLAPTAAFTWTPQNEDAPVQFTDQSTTPADAIVAWAWDFAGLATSSEQHPVFEFPGNGTWQVTLTVTDADGSTDSIAHDVIVADLAPTAAFYSAPSRPQDEGSPVQFTDQSTTPHDAIVSWQWNFGGLGSSTEADPAFTFNADGVYTVTLTVTDADGSVGSVSHDVSITDLGPTAAFTWTPNPKEDSPVQFTDASTSPADAIASRSWNFAGLGSSTLRNPSFTFNEDGVYSVTLTVTDADGSVDSITQDVTVQAAPAIANTDVKNIAKDAQATELNVLLNDVPVAASESLTIVGKTNGQHGTVEITSGGAKVSYLPEAGYSGLDSFTYTVMDDDGLASVGTVLLNVIWQGDVNDDCKINILDLIFIRNHLNGNVLTGDNRRCDINGDGKINVLDLILVRNQLNQRCP